MVTDPTHNPAQPTDPLAQARRRRAVLVSAMRIVFCVAMVSVTLVRLLVVRPDSAADERELVQLWYLTIGLAAALAAVFITLDLLTPSKKIATVTGVSMGLLIGLLATVVVSFLMDLVEKGYGLPPAWTSMVKILLGISFCYLGVTIVLQTQDDFRLVIPYVEFSKQFRGQRPMLLDSSALIDARFVEVAQTGLIHAPIVIPSFVVAELQLLADNSDRAKRQRGRRGLDSIAKLQRTASVEVSLQSSTVPGTGVDQMLVELARQTQSTIVTTDTGLARVAAIQGVQSLNMHDLASALRPTVIVGQTLTITPVRAGEQPGQAVGYLEDGMMVVIEDGAGAIGREVVATVASTLQTSAGRMVFARIGEGRTSEARSNEPGRGDAGGEAASSAAPFARPNTAGDDQAARSTGSTTVALPAAPPAPANSDQSARESNDASGQTPDPANPSAPGAAPANGTPPSNDAPRPGPIGPSGNQPRRASSWRNPRR